jgi:hypothetical protein
VELQSPSIPAWVTACSQRDEDFLVGSRAGLLEFRDHIDKALANGESLVGPESGIEFNGVRCRDEPREPYSESRWAGFVCFAGGLIFLGFALYGIAHFIRRF